MTPKERELWLMLDKINTVMFENTGFALGTPGGRKIMLVLEEWAAMD